MNPTCELVALGQRIQKLGTDGSFSGSIVGTDLTGTTAAAFEIDSDGTVPALALGSQAAGTGDFTQTFKPAATLTGSASILTIDLAAVDAEMMLQASGVILNTVTDLTNVQHDHSNAAGGGAISATDLAGTSNDTFTINTDTFGAILDSTGLSQDSTFTFPDEAGPDELCGIAATQTMTNKTLTAPTITGGTLDGIVGGVAPADGSFTTLSTSGAATLASLVCTAAGTFGGGYGSTGATITTDGNISANGTLSIDGIADFTSIVGSDSSLGITGMAGSAGNGGVVAVVGGAGDANNNGGVVSVTGGSGDGAGTGDGGAFVATGGFSGFGATGDGGAASLSGGDAGSTNGDGGANTVAGGDGTGTGTGGDIAVTGGASAGASGTAGAVAIDAGAATGGTAADVTVGAANAGNVLLGASDAPTRAVGTFEQNGAAGAASSVVRSVVRLDAISDNSATSFLTFTIPNAAHAAVARITFLAQVEDQASARVAEGTIVLERNAGADTVGTAVALTGEGIATTAAGETLTFAYALGAAVGAVGAQQTMPLNVTLNTSGATDGELIALIELINSEATGITVAAS
jgi:hypothetical protein